MRHYRATFIATGAVTEYDAVLPLPLHQGPGWLLEDVSVAEPSPGDPPPPPPVFEWTPLQVVQRLTQQERLVIVELRKSDPAAEDWMTMLAMCATVKSTDQYLIDLLAYMTTVGALAAGRSAEILGGA
jgi:hypothetical protein